MKGNIVSLATKVRKWSANNLITTEQGEAILKYESANSNGVFWRTAFLIAGSLIGFGICLIIAANWLFLPDWLKLFGDFAVLGTFLAYTYWSVINQRNNLKELFSLLSFLMIGATIGLVGQIFNLDGGWSSFASGWAILGLPLVILSRSLMFNICWICLFCSMFNFGFIEKVLDYIGDNFDGMVAASCVLCLVSYAGKKLHEEFKKYTLLAQALAELSIVLAYIAVWGAGQHWGMDWSITSSRSSSFIMILANLWVFAFIGVRMYIAILRQNVSSFKRNAVLAELYIFTLFASRFGDMLASGFGFIAGGLLVLLLIYVLKKTSKYIKNMEAFK